MKHGLKSLQGLDVDAKMNCEQGDANSSLAWVIILDIVLSARRKMIPVVAVDCDDPMAHNMQFQTCALFANHLESFAATLVQLQRKAELLAGYAAIEGMHIAEKTRRTYLFWVNKMIFDEHL